MCLWQVSIGILNNKLGESEYPEVSGGIKCFFGEKTSFLSTFTHTSSPKKFPSPKRRKTPEERLRKYVELKYGKLNNKKNNAKKKQKIVEKKS